MTTSWQLHKDFLTTVPKIYEIVHKIVREIVSEIVNKIVQEIVLLSLDPFEFIWNLKSSLEFGNLIQIWNNFSQFFFISTPEQN